MRLIHGEALSVLKTLPDASVDAVITDPPYLVKRAVELRGKGVAPRRQKSTTIGDQGWTYSKEWVSEAARVCHKHVVAFAGYLDLPDLLIDRGQGELRGVFVWQKSNAALPAWNVPHYDTEFFVWWGRGANPPGIRDFDSMVLRCPSPPAGCFADERIIGEGGAALHPSQKPLAIMRKIVRAFTAPGETGLDPFMGTGTTGVACVRDGREFVGVEINPNYFAAARKRIAEAEGCRDGVGVGELFAWAEGRA